MIVDLKLLEEVAKEKYTFISTRLLWKILKKL